MEYLDRNRRKINASSTFFVFDDNQKYYCKFQYDYVYFTFDLYVTRINPVTCELENEIVSSDELLDVIDTREGYVIKNAIVADREYEGQDLINVLSIENESNGMPLYMVERQNKELYALLKVINDFNIEDYKFEGIDIDSNKVYFYYFTRRKGGYDVRYVDSDEEESGKEGTKVFINC